MNGGSLPYHLRPHKAVDRRLFLDLLARLERWRSLSEYVYISMGAYPLEDHKLVHRLMGIQRLIAFDFDEKVVARQRFNRPIDSCYCIQRKSGDLVSGLEKELRECGFDEGAGVIVWLDYTQPKKIGEQIREFEALLDQLRAGDVVRITVNAHPAALGDNQGGSGARLTTPELQEKRFKELKNRIGDYLPSSASPDQMTVDGLPRLLAKALGAAALNAFPVAEPNIMAPLSIVRYADGQQMLSMTGIVVRRDDHPKMLERIGLNSWPFASLDWATVHQLVVPDLTLRERLFLERGIVSTPPDQLIKELGFEVASDLDVAEFLENYKNYYRFYPSLLTAEI